MFVWGDNKSLDIKLDVWEGNTKKAIEGIKVWSLKGRGLLVVNSFLFLFPERGQKEGTMRRGIPLRGTLGNSVPTGPPKRNTVLDRKGIPEENRWLDIHYGAVMVGVDKR